ncbi:MAG TPA: FAD-dependent monooxygenase [Anaeromyxobacteraceae bacterium]|nr:FAD-dependent monooxygenase [Anaeromyxobacteraceae bacterium]
MSRIRDALVAGGGPAGLAFAAAAAGRGLEVTVLERGEGPVDKACGEGLLPAGVRALHALGAAALLPAEDRSELREIRWVEEDGAEVHVALPAPGGLGVRRTALSAALAARARAAGAEIVERALVTAHGREKDHAWAEAAGRTFAARVLVAADGLASPIRRREGLDGPARGPARFGVRRHFAMRPWADAVEVHFGDRVEAYVTPAGARRVGIAFLAGGDRPLRFDDLLPRFPALAARLRGAEAETAPRGAGPFPRTSSARTKDRLVLLGDAAGYLDAITGDGLPLALGCALDLAAILPHALACGASRAALAPYERAWRRRWRVYALYTRAVLGLARRPVLRRRLLQFAAGRPAVLQRLVAAAVG